MPDELLPDVPLSAANLPDHAFTQAAREGFGPLSDQAREIWHGRSVPCASCALLNRRGAARCRHCHQDLTQPVLAKMAKHSGPWFVYDPIRPFPGVSIERLERQVQRGVLTRTSIVRGPTTFYQWRYAGETPLIAKLMGLCWKCQSEVPRQERFCPQCKVAVDGHYKPQQLEGSRLSAPEATAATAPEPGLAGTVAAAGPNTEPLSELEKVLRESQAAGTLPEAGRKSERPLGTIALVFLIIAVVVVGLLVAWVSLRSGGESAAAATNHALHGWLFL